MNNTTTSSMTSSSGTKSVVHALLDPLETLRGMDVRRMRECVRMKESEFVDWLHSMGIALRLRSAHALTPSVTVLYWLERDPVLKAKQIFLLSFLWTRGEHFNRPLAQLMPVHGSAGDLVDTMHLAEWLKRFAAVCTEWHSHLPLKLRSKGAVRELADEYLWRAEFGAENALYHFWSQVLYFERHAAAR